VNFGFSQNCVYENIPTSPPTVNNTCYIGSGSFYGMHSISNPFPCGLIFGNNSYKNKEWTIDGNLIIDKIAYFEDCTFNFTSTGTISFGKVEITYPGSQPGPLIVSFKRCTFIGCDNGTWPGINFNAHNTNGGPNVRLEDCNIKGASTGITINPFNQFNGVLTLRGVTFDQNLIGIHFNGPGRLKDHSIFNCTFQNGNIGIKMDNFQKTNSVSGLPLRVSSSNFHFLTTAILSENSEGISVSGSTFSACNKGIDVKNLRITGGNNLSIISNTLSGIYNCGICMDNLNVGSSGIIRFNKLNGVENYISQYGINLQNSFLNRLEVAFNPQISSFSDGLRIYNTDFRNGLIIARNTNVSTNQTGFRILNQFLSTGIIDINRNTLNYNHYVGMSIFNNRLADVKLNTINAYHNTTFSIALYDTELYTVEENNLNSFYEGPEIRPHMLLANGYGNKLCCNTAINKAGGIHVYGTNPMTGIRNTTFE
jgi:hypothetical protein